ncbi:hypothetical protein H4R35_007399 [Dimargaris xerosporica]|nr:hypothetical protein H4R35_007399 [Dimargaris xerosporica]
MLYLTAKLWHKNKHSMSLPLATLTQADGPAVMSVDAMIQDLGHDMLALRRIYKTFIDIPGASLSFARQRNPDIFAFRPEFADKYTDELRSALESHEKELADGTIIRKSLQYLDIAHQNGVEIVNLVTMYLERIHNVNLLSFLESKQNDPEAEFWANIITQNSPFRARYYFFDIVAFQVIPKAVVQYVEEGKLDQAVTFINSMMKEPLLLEFLTSIASYTNFNYYELAALKAFATRNNDAAAFFQQVRKMPGFSIERLHRCYPGLQKTLDGLVTIQERLELPLVTELECILFKSHAIRAVLPAKVEPSAT